MKVGKQQIINKAKLAGFPIVGFLKPHYFRDLKALLDRYVNEGYALVFTKEGIEKKCDPFLTMENCKTIVVLGAPYYSKTREEQSADDKGGVFCGRLARTAWGEDYHRVLHRRMERLAEELGEVTPGLSYQSYVDTGPLVDRYLASKAGLGFYGYNNLFYHPKYGSYVFYGYMLIDQEMEGLEDKGNIPKKGALCENCNKCIKSCPTKAIEKPYRLNASRCLSGILQKKGVLSDKEKSIIGNRIYGCDVCQQVCPYNNEVEMYSDSSFLPDNPPAWPDLIELLGLSNKEFKKIYGSNASAWRGARVLKRNALIVLGNTGDSEAIPYLTPFLNDSREDLRDAARWALNKLENGLG